MDEDQKRFVSLNADGKHLVVGPPGSGKTNLIVMRARYIYGCGLKNVLVLTFTRALQDFIRTGVGEKKYFEPEQIQTFKRWALSHIRLYAPEQLISYDKNGKFEEDRQKIIEMLKVANRSLGGKNLYDAVLVDEVQDLHIEEVKALMQISERITVAGDSKQMIYSESGQTIPLLDDLGFSKTTLRYHYRIGRAISDVADKALQPENDADRLQTNCNYKEDELQSRAELLQFASRQEQFDVMYKTIVLQLRSYLDEDVGILVPLTTMVTELQGMFDKTPLAKSVAYHNDNSVEQSFQSGKRIHVIVLKSAKGTEFRAVHLYGLEELKFPQVRRELLFMAITRAKTALTGYYSGRILKSVETAFAKAQTPPSLADLF
ncbi:MAG: AAA family ATPase [Methylobacter sp.]|uniref:UvrD-helicase domain-containing protein n=1 Tax=Methylobacter sp. TaxID=2051955 RepID=UPI0027302E4D|nr:UvrD-helicase domain-containing protein [Methylobacter sp.]MDP1665551.1 AAA family ATPase [Methylobacter sp.]